MPVPPSGDIAIQKFARNSAPVKNWLKPLGYQAKTRASNLAKSQPKRGTKNSLAQQGRKSEHQPWFFGIRFALLIATWDLYRLPVAFRLIRVKTHPEYRTENALFREMVRGFVPPLWAKRIIVEGDAAYGS